MFKDRPDLEARAMKRQLEKIAAGAVECTCGALTEAADGGRSARGRAHSPDCQMETAWIETVEEIRREDLESEIDQAADGIGDFEEEPDAYQIAIMEAEEDMDRAIVAGDFDDQLEPGEKAEARERLAIIDARRAGEPCAKCNGLGTIPNPRDHELNVRARCPFCNADGRLDKSKITFNVRSSYQGPDR